MRPSDLRPFALVAALSLAACVEAVPAQYGGQPPPGGGVGQLSTQDWGPAATPPMQLPPPGPPVMSDPINDVNLPWLRAAAGGVLGELTAALPDQLRARVEGIPFITDPAVDEVNAFAACNAERMPLMAVTDGLLQIESYMAQLRAVDDVFGTHKLDQYLDYVAKNQKPRQPILAPPPGMIEPAQHTEYRKVVREHQLLEEQLAFVLGHELAHHYLGHTGCAVGQTGARRATSGDLARKLSHIIPIASMGNEVNADIAGVNNLLTAGSRRRSYRWTETGALLTLKFFASMDRLTSVQDYFASLLNSHPNPAQRVPRVQDAAAHWRRTGGAGYAPSVVQ